MMILTRRLDANHDMTFGQGLQSFARGEEAVVQNVTTRLLLLQGEWFLDTSAGVPYLQDINIKNPNLDFVEAVLKQTILDTDGVLEITEFSFDYDSVTRTVGVVTAAIVIYNGNVLTIQVPLS